MKKILVTAAAALMLSGCQSVPHNPYSWQYAAGRETVCLETDACTDVAFTIPLRQALADKGVTVVESASAGCTKRLAFSAQTGGWSGAEIRKAQLVLTDIPADGAMAPVTGYRVTVENTVSGGMLDTPAGDATTMIRTLVDRMFPDPKPWNPD